MSNLPALSNLRYYKKPQSSFKRFFSNLINKILQVKNLSFFKNRTFSYTLIIVVVFFFLGVISFPYAYSSQAENVNVLEIDSKLSNQDVIIESKKGQFYVEFAGLKYYAEKKDDIWEAIMPRVEGENEIKVGNYLKFGDYIYHFEPKKTMTVRRTYGIKNIFTVSIKDYVSIAKQDEVSKLEYTIETTTDSQNLILKNDNQIIYELNNGNLNPNHSCTVLVVNVKKIFSCVYVFNKEENEKAQKEGKNLLSLNIKAFDTAGNTIEITKDRKVYLVPFPKIECKPKDKNNLKKGENKIICKSNNSGTFKLNLSKDKNDLVFEKNIDKELLLGLEEGLNTLNVTGLDEFNQKLEQKVELEVKKETKVEGNFKSGTGFNYSANGLDYSIRPLSEVIVIPSNGDRGMLTVIFTANQSMQTMANITTKKFTNGKYEIFTYNEPFTFDRTEIGSQATKNIYVKSENIKGAYEVQVDFRDKGVCTYKTNFDTDNRTSGSICVKN
jgi:hypothetical protein